MSKEPAARVGDDFAHSSALMGALVGLAVGAAIGVFVVATAGTGAALVMAAGAAVAATGGLGMAGQYIGESIQGPATGQLMTGSPNVFTNGKPAGAAVLSMANCKGSLLGIAAPHPSERVATGSDSVFVNGYPAARKTEKLTCSAKIIKGSSNVFIGGESVQVLPMEPEVPTWLSNTMLIMLVGGTIVATGGAVAVYGWGVALGGLALGVGGSMLGGWGGGEIAERLGLGETGQRVFEVVGGFAGGMAGGFAGGRLGGRLFPKNPKPDVVRAQLIDEVVNNGHKITPENVVGIRRLPDGRIVWLETGNDKAGLQHIVLRHGNEFAGKGIPKDQIPVAIFTALEKGRIVGYQGRDTGRPIYEFTFNGQTHRLAITVGDNGFIVGVNAK